MKITPLTLLTAVVVLLALTLLADVRDAQAGRYQTPEPSLVPDRQEAARRAVEAEKMADKLALMEQRGEITVNSRETFARLGETPAYSRPQCAVTPRIRSQAATAALEAEAAVLEREALSLRARGHDAEAQSVSSVADYLRARASVYRQSLP